ncbi:MAG: HlyC/CorC family transporter [Bdellovibrionales bacterium]|nr:HlyC/CorC family transporter [Bdellovibrionales bacterium]
MTFLVVAVGVALFISATCSLMEAALFAVPLPHVRHLADSGSRAGQTLLRFKNEIGKPIGAILILNTISHTVGAAVSGAAAAALFGESGVWIFSVVFTLLILYLSEIIPKQIGVTYSRQVAPMIALPLAFLIKIIYPLVVITEQVSRRFGESDEPLVSEEEVLSLTAMGKEEGVLDALEGTVIENIIGLENSMAKDVLTPRVVVFRLDENLQLRDIAPELEKLNFSRIPLYDPKDPDTVTHFILQRDIYRALLRGEETKMLKEVARPMRAVPEFISLDQLLEEMFESHEQICTVVDEHGGFAGIVTLEDVLEEVVGVEIVDEYDTIEDMRAHAQKLARRRRRRRLARQQKESSNSEDQTQGE